MQQFAKISILVRCFKGQFRGWEGGGKGVGGTRACTAGMGGGGRDPGYEGPRVEGNQGGRDPG